MRCRAHVFPAPGKLDRATNTLDLVGRNRRSVQRVSESPEVGHQPPHQDPLPRDSHFTDGETEAGLGGRGWLHRAVARESPRDDEASHGPGSEPWLPMQHRMLQILQGVEGPRLTALLLFHKSPSTPDPQRPCASCVQPPGKVEPSPPSPRIACGRAGISKPPECKRDRHGGEDPAHLVPQAPNSPCTGVWYTSQYSASLCASGS